MVIQVGTPEEIVMNPKDDYVADFVKGISRLEVVKAKSIMKSIDQFTQESGAIPNEAVRMNENDDLSSLIELSVSSNNCLDSSIVSNLLGRTPIDPVPRQINFSTRSGLITAIS